MGNFEKLSVLVIVVIIVMILVVALYTWQDNGDDTTTLDSTKSADPVDSASNPDPLDLGPGESPWPGSSLGEGLPSDDLVNEPPVDPMDDLTTPELAGVGEPGEEFGDDPGDEPGREPGEESETPGEEPAESDEPWMYTIKSGDTLSQIAERELGTFRRMKEILSLNAGLDPLKIRAGDQIKMPPRGRMPSVRDAPGSASTPGGTSAGARRGGTIPTGEYYVSQPGDRLQSIAKRAYGSMDRWPELWARNLSSVPNIDDGLPTGTRIFIPK